MNTLNGVKRQLKRQVKSGEILSTRAPFTKHSKIYLTANENVAAYTDLVKETDAKSALTVLASGDQAFNLVANGVYDIDTFDTNHITEYYVLGFRRAMIAKYDYQNYLSITKKIISHNTSFYEICDIVMGLLGYMDEPYRTFWHKFVDYNYKIQRNKPQNFNPFVLLAMEENLKIENIISGNNYLTNEDEYKIFRHMLGHANITFKPANALKLAKSFSDKYDTILLSNILDFAFFNWSQYFGYQKLKEYQEELLPLLTDNGLLFLYYNFHDTKNPIIGDSYVLDKHLTTEETIMFPAKSHSGNDSMLLVRKKGNNND